jgi:dihydroorotase
MTAVRSVTQGPAKVLGLNIGHLEVGSSADFCIIDPEAAWTLESASMVSEGKNSPFIGWEFIGQVEQTYFQGRPVYRNNQI